MIMNGVRFVWGFDGNGHRITLRLDHDGISHHYASHRLGDGEGCGLQIEALLELLVSKGALQAEARNVMVGMTRELFESWGHRWESVS